MNGHVLKVPFSGRGFGDRGSITHALIATHAPRLAQVDNPRHLVPSLVATGRALVSANANHRQVVAAEAASLAASYLSRFAPAAPWTLLGVEYDSGAGRVDAAWLHPDGSVLFDEVKTARFAGGRVSEAWLSQARRYSQAGALRFGDHFLGTRVLPLSRSALTGLVCGRGKWSRLSEVSPHCPLGSAVTAPSSSFRSEP